MADEPLLLGVDVGSSRIKAVLVDPDGREAAHASATTPFTTTGGRVEMTADDLHGRVADVLSDLGDARARVAGVGLAGMAESGAPLDGGRRPLAPVIAWHDERGQEVVDLLEARFGHELALRIGQPVRTVLTAVKLGWLLGHGVSGLSRWLGVPELLLHALTGAEATEFSLAARTGCYDVACRAWMPEVGEACGFSTDVFPPVRAAGSTMGTVSPGGAAWSGVPRGVPVTVAGHDHLSGMVGAGVQGHTVANSVGTAETLLVRAPVVPDIGAALEQRGAVTLFPGGEQWAALVSTARSGLVLESAASKLGRSPQDLDRLAEDAVAVDVPEPGPEAPLPEGPPGAVWAGLLEALARKTADGFRRLQAFAGDLDEVVVFGGGSLSGPWLEAKAGALPVAVWRSTVDSAVARGAAVHAGVAAGWWRSPDQAPAPARERVAR